MNAYMNVLCVPVTKVLTAYNMYIGMLLHGLMLECLLYACMYTSVVMYCIVFIHFYSASHSMSLSEALPTTAIALCRSLHAEALLLFMYACIYVCIYVCT